MNLGKKFAKLEKTCLLPKKSKLNIEYRMAILNVSKYLSLFPHKDSVVTLANLSCLTHENLLCSIFLSLLFLPARNGHLPSFSYGGRGGRGMGEARLVAP